MAIKSKNNLILKRKGSGSAWDVVPGAFTSGGGGQNNERIDVTSFDTAGNSRAFIGGLSEPQPMTFEINYEPGDAIQQAIRTQNADGSAHDYRISFGAEDDTAPEDFTVTCLVTKCANPTGPVEGKLSMAIELTPTIAGTWADAA